MPFFCGGGSADVIPVEKHNAQIQQLKLTVSQAQQSHRASTVRHEMEGEAIKKMIADILPADIDAETEMKDSAVATTLPQKVQILLEKYEAYQKAQEIQARAKVIQGLELAVQDMKKNINDGGAGLGIVMKDVQAIEIQSPVDGLSAEAVEQDLAQKMAKAGTKLDASVQELKKWKKRFDRLHNIVAKLGIL